MLGSEVECEANCGQEQLDLLRRFHLGIPALLGQGALPSFRASSVSWEVIDAFPFPESGREARVIISPIRTAVDLSAALRITAPRGYQWAVTQEDMEIAIGSTEELPGDSYQWRHGTHGRG